MRHERILGILILSDFILGILGIGSDSLRAFLAEGGAAARPSHTLLKALWVAVVIGTVVAWIGLLNLVRAARPLYVGAWAAYFVFILLRGPVASTAVDDVMQMLMALVGGAIIALVYFSELRTRFRTLAEAVGVTRSAAPRSG